MKISQEDVILIKNI